MKTKKRKKEEEKEGRKNEGREKNIIIKRNEIWLAVFCLSPFSACKPRRMTIKFHEK
jgi:hypothetical protein